MKFKEVAHMYIGCEFIVPNRYNFGGRITDLTKATVSGIKDGFISFDQVSGFYPIEDFKPILHPLSDMTEDEKVFVGRLISDSPDRLPVFAKEDSEAWAIRKGMRPVMSLNQSTEVTFYLLSKHFDLFGLIESGEAIDSTKF